ncbi:MAG: hypothetical protein LC775_17550, partial [Acidobacteria bacterium]|nr:hypothetical protein [Acidobacteriota bacterium]
FPVENEEVRISEDNRLGFGKTDTSGRATIEFRSPAKYSEYVLAMYSKGSSAMMLALGGKIVTFQCNEPTCDLGVVKGESLRFVNGTARVR